MPHSVKFALYLAVMAGVTYLVRSLPLLLVKKKIENRFIRSFLYYVPYAVLAVMTVPAIFYATASGDTVTFTDMIPAISGFVMALLLAYFEKNLLTVAIASCATVFLVQLLFLVI